MKTKKVSQSLRHIVAKSGKNGEQTWLPLWMHAEDTAGVMASRQLAFGISMGNFTKFRKTWSNDQKRNKKAYSLSRLYPRHREN